MVRPERFELPTPWFEAKESAIPEHPDASRYHLKSLAHL